ncbi:hypothetical protein AB4099_29570 [Bosea sp. 2KB_26]|uniref:hypothetical protein n=1 Tax=Bosea sp. 2KB_26 TaxID=3237475 RepID=UPI003F920A16
MNIAPPPRIAYGRYDRITIGAIAYTSISTDDRGQYLRRVDDSELVEWFTHEELAKLERSRNYRYERDYFNHGKVRARQRSGVENFGMIPREEQPSILWKWEYCNRFQAMVNDGKALRSNEGMEEAIARITPDVIKLDCAKVGVAPKKKKGLKPRKDGRPRKGRSGRSSGLRDVPTYRTLQRWLAILDSCGWEIESLRDNYRHRGNHTERHPSEIIELLSEHARNFASQARKPKAFHYDQLDKAVTSLNGVRASEVRIPTNSAGNSDMNSAPCSDFIPAPHSDLKPAGAR